MHFEKHFRGGRSSRFVLRKGESALFGARKIFAARSEGTEPHSHRQLHRSVVLRQPIDRTRRTSSGCSWRRVSAVIFASVVPAAHVLRSFGEFLLCRVLYAAVSWIFVQALEGCAAYAAAMHGMPVEEFCGRRDPADDKTEREHADRLTGQYSVKSSTNADARMLYLTEAGAATSAAEFVAPPLAPRVPSSGWIASVSSIVAGFRSKIRQLRGRRLAAVELQSLDDRSLRDLGISRGDIEYLVRHRDRRE